MPAAEAPPPLESFLTWRLHLAAKLTDRASGDAYADAFGLPVGEARCLAAAGDAAPMSVVELAARANLHKGPASRAAQSLVERGLMAKAASVADARAVVLSLTPAGRRLWRDVMRLIAQRNEEIFGCLSSAERAQLGGLLDRIAAHARTGAQRP